MGHGFCRCHGIALSKRMKPTSTFERPSPRTRSATQTTKTPRLPAYKDLKARQSPPRPGHCKQCLVRPARRYGRQKRVQHQQLLSHCERECLPSGQRAWIRPYLEVIRESILSTEQSKRRGRAQADKKRNHTARSSNRQLNQQPQRLGPF